MLDQSWGELVHRLVEASRLETHKPGRVRVGGGGDAI